MDYITLLILGVIITLLGIPNLKGNISTVHWYNRRKVSEKDAPKYGKAMGLGSVIIGVSIVLTAILLMVFGYEFLYFIILAGIIIGLTFILYAQFKYNKGIF